MVLFVILLSISGLFAYAVGNTNTLILGSRYIFHRSLYAYPRNNRGLTLFLRDSTREQRIKLVLMELVRDSIPVLLAGWIMSKYNITQLARAFAMLCLLLGNNFPFMYRFKGQPSLVTFAVASLCVYPQLGLAVIFVYAVVYFISRYISLSAIVAAFTAFVLSIVAMDNTNIHRLFFVCFLLVVIEYRKNIVRLFKGKEPKWRYKKDISYMFDEK